MPGCYDVDWVEKAFTCLRIGRQKCCRRDLREKDRFKFEGRQLEKFKSALCNNPKNGTSWSLLAQRTYLCSIDRSCLCLVNYIMGNTGKDKEDYKKYGPIKW